MSSTSAIDSFYIIYQGVFSAISGFNFERIPIWHIVMRESGVITANLLAIGTKDSVSGSVSASSTSLSLSMFISMSMSV